jgi:hypothetical protein
MIHFVEALRSAHLENDVLTLENGASFFGWTKLYVRKAYIEITARIFKEGIYNLSISFFGGSHG